MGYGRDDWTCPIPHCRFITILILYITAIATHIRRLYAPHVPSLGWQKIQSERLAQDLCEAWGRRISGCIPRPEVAEDSGIER